MTLNSENYIERINAFTQEDWKPLLDLIPEIEKTEEFGEYHGPEKIGEEEYTLPICFNVPLIDRFLDIAYEMPIIIDFNWAAWDEGREMARNPDFDFNTIDIPTKCKIITAIVRNDRFCEGALMNAFESGFMVKMLKSIKQQLDM
ncbi:MAG: hypothetical protein IH597_07450 [Bacteroidales bacterium]|nr:hypothetical protein [Bacteroidales bacterium]